jgi:hypothetical protein
MKLFLDIYRYYASGNSSYEQLIRLLKARWTNRNNDIMRLVNILERDMVLSKN